MRSQHVLTDWPLVITVVVPIRLSILGCLRRKQFGLWELAASALRRLPEMNSLQRGGSHLRGIASTCQSGGEPGGERELGTLVATIGGP
jgi:hypothetical protein